VPTPIQNPMLSMLRMLGVQLPPPIPAAERQPWQDMPGSGPKPIPDAILKALTDVPKGMITGGGREPGMTAENLGALLSFLGPALAKIVYHGTPHVFAPEPGAPLGRFHNEKIGTGEGAQAYGHGMYFAESPSTARSYASKLGVPDNEAIRQINLRLSTIAAEKDALLSESRANAVAQGLKTGVSEEVLQKWSDLGDEYQRLLSQRHEILNRRGSLYEADLPDDAIAKMLDWDAPVPESIREGLPSRMQALLEGSGGYGSDFYKTILGGGRKASSQLNDMGIPGIKYLDAMSRGAGQGTRNYVVFDDQLPKIVGVQR
jgi:hypothetical protein